MAFSKEEKTEGFERTIDTIDGKELIVMIKPNEISGKTYTKIINGEGMPEFGNDTERGRMIINFYQIIDYANDKLEPQKKKNVCIDQTQVLSQTKVKGEPFSSCPVS